MMKNACGKAHLKVILATGELGSLTNVHKASMVAMMAGKYDFTYVKYFDTKEQFRSFCVVFKNPR